MPKRKVISKFAKDPTYDEAKGLLREIADARIYLNKKLDSIDNIADATFQIICMFSLIDCLAQESANYPTNKPQNAFSDFVIKHQKQCDYIEEVEPITLYYRIEKFVDEKVPIKGCNTEKEVSLDSLGNLHAVPLKNILSKGKSKEILEYIRKKKGTEFADKKAKDHKLISLLYRMRNKAVHEMSGLGESFKKSDYVHPKEPYYVDMGRVYVAEGNVVSDAVIELVIPNSFLRNILSDCVDGYLDECLKEKRSPFSNNKITRLYRLSWYDKL